MEFIGQTDLRPSGLDQVQIGDSALTEFPDDEGEQLQGIAVVDPAILAKRREAYAQPVGANGSRHLVDDFEQEPGAVLFRPAIGIGALVGSVLQELLDQVAIRALQLHSIKSSLDRVQRGLTERADNDRNFRGLQGARNLGRHLLKVFGQCRNCGRNGRGRDGRASIRHERRVRVPSIVRDLHDDPAAAGVDGIGHCSPPGNLGCRIDPRSVRITLRLRTNRGSFRDDQPG